MKPKYLITAVVAFISIIAWNVFLIHRDTEMFKSYYMPSYEQTK